MELLMKLYKIYSPTGKETSMVKFIVNHLKEIPGIKIEMDESGNLYITKGESETYPCITAHLDQVQRLHSKDFTAIQTRELIFGYSPSAKRQEGLGADDKNGIWIALKCLVKYETLKAAFFVAEEVGCIGSSNAYMEFFRDCRFVIQPDRKGYKDIITEIFHLPLCSDEFLKDTGYKKFGYKKTEGMMTDVQALKERGLPISCINLSCGYYQPHTDHEFTVKEDLLRCLRLIESVIENCTKVYPHHPDPAEEYKYFNSGVCDQYEQARYEIFDILDMDSSLTADDLFCMYHTNFPFMEKEDFEEIRDEYFDWEIISSGKSKF